MDADTPKKVLLPDSGCVKDTPRSNLLSGGRMKFHETRLEGVWIIETTPFSDERGSFARTFCEEEFGKHGLETRFVQHSCSRSTRAGTLRGLHFQRVPFWETKLVSCLSGAIWDVVVDLRRGSPTFLQSLAIELTSDNDYQLYVPKGFAHGFQTLSDNVVVSYLISQFYRPDASTGLRFDDPALGISLPFVPTVVSQRDRSWPLVEQGTF